MMIRKLKLSAVLVLSMFMAQSVSAAIIDVGPETTVFTGLTRGYFFVAPTDFTVVGLGVATDASTDNFDVALLLFNTAPALFPSSTTDFDTLFLSRDNAGAGLLATSIDIKSGDIIGVLGSRGANSINSYGDSPYSSSILGSSVTLSRLLMQGDLRSVDPSSIGVSTENLSGVGRVLIDVRATESVPVPAPATLALLGLGLAGLGWKRRK